MMIFRFNLKMSRRFSDFFLFLSSIYPFLLRLYIYFYSTAHIYFSYKFITINIKHNSARSPIKFNGRIQHIKCKNLFSALGSVIFQRQVKNSMFFCLPCQLQIKNQSVHKHSFGMFTSLTCQFSSSHDIFWSKRLQTFIPLIQSLKMYSRAKVLHQDSTYV